MSVKKIYLYPSKTLRLPSSEVDLKLDQQQLQDLFRDMHDTVLRHGAAGLSAIQIGVPLRVVHMGGQVLHGMPLTLINPKIIGTTGDTKLMDEGCLSVPHVKAKLPRHECVLVSFTDETGVSREEKFKFMAAQCIEHEMEHLDGKIFLDKFPGEEIAKIRTSMTNLWRQTFNTAHKTYRMD